MTVIETVRSLMTARIEAMASEDCPCRAFPEVSADPFTIAAREEMGLGVVLTHATTGNPNLPDSTLNAINHALVLAMAWGYMLGSETTGQALESAWTENGDIA